MTRWSEHDRTIRDDAHAEGVLDGFAWGLGVMGLTIIAALKVAGVL